MSELAQQLREDAEFMIVVRPVDLPREQRITWIAAAELDRLTAEVAANCCDACAGTGTPISGGACMCGGSGKMSDAAKYLRERLVEREAEVAGLKEALLDCCDRMDRARGILHSKGNWAMLLDTTTARAALAAQEPTAQEQK